MKANALTPRRMLATALSLLVPTLALAATVSGTVAFPTSDAGYTIRTGGTKIRVEGKSLAANVVENYPDWFTGKFTLANVPAGPVTLILEEPLSAYGYVRDAFTPDSKRIELQVSGDVGDVAFVPVHCWRNLPSYPPPYQNPSYDIWEPHFVSPDVGFMGFQNRGVSPYEVELWRTTDGGESWQLIGHWVRGVSDMFPDITGSACHSDSRYMQARRGGVLAPRVKG